MNLTELIDHPERMDRETLYDLRSVIALHPYHQTARILMLQNLYLLHDPTFDEELRRAAIYITDRKVLFDMIEAAHYKLRATTQQAKADSKQTTTSGGGSRTAELIDNFLETLPEVSEEEKKPKRKPTPADAAIDYVAYLLETENNPEAEEAAPQLKGQNLIDDFIFKEHGKMTINVTSEEGVASEQPAPQKDKGDTKGKEQPENAEDSIYTETMARIYVRQGRYSQALEIIKRLNLENPKKNAYFADQIRFLEKLIVNNNKKNK